MITDGALRDERTSYHYAAPADYYSDADPELVTMAAQWLRQIGSTVLTGATWTTDAPFRETSEAIAAARARGILAVEMEAAASYAFASAKNNKVCLSRM